MHVGLAASAAERPVAGQFLFTRGVAASACITCPRRRSAVARHQLRQQHIARLVCNATETSAPVVQEAALEDLSGEDKQLWEDGLQQLRDIGMDDKLAEKSLKRGFGWSSQAYWWKQKVKEVPQSGEIKEKLDYLRGLGLTEEQLLEAVQHFPETVGLDLEKRMKPNVELMGKKFFIKGKMLPKTLARKPQSLGYAVDCEGDCQGDCTRCWSHF